MAHDAQANSVAAATARCLESHRADVLMAYERRLNDRRSPLIADPVARQQLRAHASEVLDAMLASLQNRQNPGEGLRVLAKDIGSARAGRGMHPAESLRAAGDLFQVLMSALARCLGMGEEGPVTLAVLAMHQAMSLRLEDAAAAYYGFLLDRLRAARLDEGQHLARELHDQVGTCLTVAYRQLELYEMSLKGGPGAADYRIQRAQRALVQAMDQVRQLMVGLRITKPEESVETGLRNYVKFVAAEGVAAEVIVNGDEAWATSAVRSEVFLVVREALRNAVQHSGSSVIRARISIAPHELWAEVDDDGVGFDPLVATSSGTGTGLPSMRERVEMMAGTFSLSSFPGKGTHVEIRIPLGEAEDAAW
jgi:signal transduction histidine kinase